MPDSGGTQRQRETYNYAQWPRIKSLFDHALGIEPADRDAWLAAACQDDPPLQKDVQKLLSDYESGYDIFSPQPEEQTYTFVEGMMLADRFRIIRLIGSGGMGEVYEAEDVTMQERLALKTLRPELTGDVALIARFRRELQLSRQIAHPNVCRVSEFYQLRDAAGRLLVFFTMELLQGETLGRRISSLGRMAPEQVLPIIRQIAAGLAAAHVHGVVHRDLKPANIMLIDEGQGNTRAVVMDFGLARSIQPGSASETRTGAVLGTFFYMAPEQFKGEPITSSCDIYAFGVTIFEMLTGRSHPMMALRSSVPGLDPRWEEAIHACCETDPAKRPGSAAEVISIIERPRPAWRGRRRAIQVAAGLGGLTLIAASLLVWGWLSVPPQRPPVITRLTGDNGFTTNPSFSRDGKLLVYASDRGARGDMNIWLQHIDTGVNSQLTDDPANEDEPAISPDGRMVAFRNQRDDMLYVMPVEGGPPRAIAKWGQDPQFSPDGTEIAYWTGQEAEHTEPSGQIWTVRVSGGETKTLSAGFADARYPIWSPDGSKILFRGARSMQPSLDANTDWWVVASKGGSPVATGAGAILRSANLALQASGAQWDGKSVVFSATVGHTTNLWRMNLPVTRLRASEAPVRLTTSTDREITPSLLPDGRIAYTTWHFTSHIWRIGVPNGASDQITDGDLSDSVASVSSDGESLVFLRRAGEHRNIMLRSLRDGSERSLASNEATSAYISPAGNEVAFSVEDSIYLQPFGSAASVLCSKCGLLLGWTPDATGLLLRVNPGRTDTGIDWLDSKGSKPRRIISAPGLTDAAVSPDNGMVAFAVRQNGVLSQIFVARMAGGHAGVQSTAITPPNSWADSPIWSADGKYLLFSAQHDGFQCIWRQRIDRVTMTVTGIAQAIYHFHRAGFSPGMIARSAFRLSTEGDSLYLNVGSVQGNIWMLQP
jgi:serine/threonine protein kinase